MSLYQCAQVVTSDCNSVVIRHWQQQEVTDDQFDTCARKMQATLRTKIGGCPRRTRPRDHLGTQPKGWPSRTTMLLEPSHRYLNLPSLGART